MNIDNEHLDGVINAMLNGVKIERIRENLAEKKVTKSQRKMLIEIAEDALHEKLGPSIKEHLLEDTLSHDLPAFNKMSLALFERLKEQQLCIIQNDYLSENPEKSLLELHYESMPEVQTYQVPLHKRIRIKKKIRPYWIVGLSIIIFCCFQDFETRAVVGAKGLILGISIIALGYRNHAD